MEVFDYDISDMVVAELVLSNCEVSRGVGKAFLRADKDTIQEADETAHVDHIQEAHSPPTCTSVMREYMARA